MVVSTTASELGRLRALLITDINTDLGCIQWLQDGGIWLVLYLGREYLAQGVRARYVTERTLVVLGGTAITISAADRVVVCVHLFCRPITRGRFVSFRQSHAATAGKVREFTNAAVVLSRVLQYTRVNLLDAVVNLKLVVLLSRPRLVQIFIHFHKYNYLSQLNYK